MFLLYFYDICCGHVWTAILFGVLFFGAAGNLHLKCNQKERKQKKKSERIKFECVTDHTRTRINFGLSVPIGANNFCELDAFGARGRQFSPTWQIFALTDSLKRYCEVGNIQRRNLFWAESFLNVNLSHYFIINCGTLAEREGTREGECGFNLERKHSHENAEKRRDVSECQILNDIRWPPIVYK